MPDSFDVFIFGLPIVLVAGFGLLPDGIREPFFLVGAVVVLVGAIAADLWSERGEVR